MTFDAVWRNHGRRRVTIDIDALDGVRTPAAGPKEATANTFADIRVVRGRVLGGSVGGGGASMDTHARAYQVLVDELPETLRVNLGAALFITDEDDSDDADESPDDPLRREVQGVEYGFDGRIATLVCGDPAR